MKSVKINLTVTVNNREIAFRNSGNNGNTFWKRFLPISAQKYAKIGTELSLANVLDNYSFYLFLSKKKLLKFLSLQHEK